MVLCKDPGELQSMPPSVAGDDWMDERLKGEVDMSGWQLSHAGPWIWADLSAVYGP